MLPDKITFHFTFTNSDYIQYKHLCILWIKVEVAGELLNNNCQGKTECQL